MTALPRKQILAVVDSARRATRQLQSLLQSPDPDLGQVEAALAAGAIVEDVAIPVAPRHPGQPPPSPMSAVDRAAQINNPSLFMMLRAAARGRPGQSRMVWMIAAADRGADTCLSQMIEKEGAPRSHEDRLKLAETCVDRNCPVALDRLLSSGFPSTSILRDSLDNEVCLLHGAIDASIVRVLVRHGCPLNHPDSRGVPPLGAMISKVSYERLTERVMGAIDELLQHGPELSLESSGWGALAQLMRQRTVPVDLVARLARLDPDAAKTVRPDTVGAAMGLLDSGVAGAPESLSERIRWDALYLDFKNDAAPILELLARGVPSPNIAQVSPDRLTDWLRIGIDCPVDKVARLLQDAEYAREEGDWSAREYFDIDILKDVEKLAASSARAQARRMENETCSVSVGHSTRSHRL